MLVLAVCQEPHRSPSPFRSKSAPQTLPPMIRSLIIRSPIQSMDQQHTIIDGHSADDLIGFALLPATPLFSSSAAAPFKFDLPLRKNGLAKGRGRVRGKVRLEWPEEGESFFEDKSKKGRLPKHVQLARQCCTVS